MSKTSLLLLILLIFACGLYFYIKTAPTNPILPAVTKKIVKDTSSSEAKVTLMTSPERSGQVFSVFAQISSSSPQTGLVQLELGYDPTVLTALTVTPGMYFTHPKVLLLNINQHLGRISFAVACEQSSKTESCINLIDQPAAKITFEVTALAKRTDIKLLPKTLVKTTNEVAIPVKLSGTTVNLVGTVTPQTSASATLKTK